MFELPYKTRIQWKKGLSLLDMHVAWLSSYHSWDIVIISAPFAKINYLL
jgi:lysophospholipid acyltransferase (LPLAT)-like uncharacterized protein